MSFWITLRDILRKILGYKDPEPAPSSPSPRTPPRLNKPTPDLSEFSPADEPSPTIDKDSTMELEVLRYSSQSDSTLGALFDVTNGRKFLCYTLEDEYRTQKVYEETRIPAGRYKVLLRSEGGFHTKYAAKFGSMHKGMLWLQDVPGFQWVLIHIGNKDEDTAGCLLVGDTSTQNITEEGMVGSSTTAYKRIYPPIAAAIETGEEVYITYVDYDVPT